MKLRMFIDKIKNLARKNVPVGEKSRGIENAYIKKPTNIVSSSLEGKDKVMRESERDISAY